MSTECPFCTTRSPRAEHFPCESGPEPRRYTIDRISGNGNAVSTSGANLGPLVSEAVGKELNGIPIDGTFVFCVDSEFWESNYQEKFEQMASPGTDTTTSTRSQSRRRSDHNADSSGDEGENLKEVNHEYEGETTTKLGASLDELVSGIEPKQSDDQDSSTYSQRSENSTSPGSSAPRTGNINKTSSRSGNSDASRGSGNQTDQAGSGGTVVTEKELIKEIRYASYDIDGPPKPQEVYATTTLSHNDVLEHFDSFDEAAEAAGIDLQQECLDEINYVTEKVKRLPGKTDVSDEGRVSPRFILRYFDSWTDVQRAYLSQDGNSFANPSEQFLLGEVERLTGKRNFTDLVLYSDLENSVFEADEYIDRFGSLSAALREVGVEPKKEISDLLGRIDEQVDGDLQSSHVQSARSLEPELVEEVFGSVESALDYVSEDRGGDKDSETGEDAEHKFTETQKTNEDSSQERGPLQEDDSTSESLNDEAQSLSLEGEEAETVNESPMDEEQVSETDEQPVADTGSMTQESGKRSIDSEDAHDRDTSAADGEESENARTETDAVSTSDMVDETTEGTDGTEPDDVGTVEIFWDQDVDVLPVSGSEEFDENHAGTGKQADDLDKKIDQWKSQCLDLTRRNHLINFTETQSKSLPLVNGSAPDVADVISQEGRLYLRKDTGDDTEKEEATALESSELLPSRSRKKTEKSLSSIARNQKQYLRERGVDTLYMAFGHLCWYSVDYSDEQIRSPLFLISVELQQTNVRDSGRYNYVIQPKFEQVRVNPALRQKLEADHGVTLPVDDALTIEKIDAAFETVHQAIQGFERWHIQDATVLGIFDFTKYSVYEDIEANREQIKEDPTVQALQGDTEALRAREGDIETPSADELDSTIDPVDVYQVLDADSSQQEAIEAAKRGKSFVLQGPPGTGKSQTIANVIAEKLADGEQVLFVSEKQAALDVVKNRLADVDLGRFCLEAHGQKATAKEVVSQLDEEIKSTSVKPAKERERKLRKLRDRRDQINEYGEHLFYSPKNWDLTVYQAFGIVCKHDDVPYIETGINDRLAFSEQTVQSAIDQLETLAQFQDILNQYDNGPWCHATLSNWSIGTAQSMERSLQNQQAAIEQLQQVASEVEEQIGYRPDSVAQTRDVLSLVTHYEDRPDVQWSRQLLDREFVRSRKQLESIVEIECERAELLRDLTNNYERSFLELNAADLNTELAQYGLFKILRPSYRSLRRKLLNHTKTDYNPSHEDLLDDTQKLATLQRLERNRNEYDHVIQQLGHLYKSEDTDWETVLEIHDWVTELYEYDCDKVETVIENLVSDRTIDGSTLRSRISDALDAFDDAGSFFRSSMEVDLVQVGGEPFEDATFGSLRDELAYLQEQVPTLQRRVQFNSQLQLVQDTLCEEYVENFVNEEYDPENLVPGFKHQFYTLWLKSVYSQTGLSSFNSEQFERYLNEFRQLDKTQQELGKIEIQHKILSRRPSLSLDHATDAEQVIVKREAKKQQQHKPLRQLFDEAGDFITQLTPCFMMSPLSVAQYLKPDAIEFDTVIFDEASQVMPHDAISSIIRADQAIIAGDSKQLPPTSFFSTNIDPTDDVRVDLDSILEEASAVLPEKRLRWHYRSRDSELIAFSNHQYYSNSLQTFPDNDQGTETGVIFEYVSDGVYDRGGSQRNEIEAERVVDLIESHAKNHADKSLGVVAFSQSQQDAIRDKLEERSRSNRVLKSFVNQSDVLDEFFIKNLETVQGDERDRMVFSIGYGPDQNGKLSMNFGPLNTSGGERRLNVAITRARESVTVVSSIQPEDIDLTRTNSAGVEGLKKYLQYAKDGEEVLARDQQVSGTLQFDSQFEEAVYNTLTERGLDVVTQVQSAGYSVDLAIKHPEKTGTFILGIECDGAAYHSSKTARDRDRTRQAILEDLGWTIHRIWSPDWISNTDREVQRIEDKINSLIEDPTADGKYSQQPETSKTLEPEPVEELDAEEHEHDDITTYEQPSLGFKQDLSYDEIPSEEISQSMKQIVNQAGPISKDAVYRSVVERWGISRIGSQINRSLASHTGALQRKDEIVRRGSFLWPSKEVLNFTIRTHDEGATRDIENIPVEELAKAAYLILSEGGRMTRKDLELEVSRLYGYQRRGKRIQSRFTEVIDLLADIDAIQKHDNRFEADENTDIDHLLLSKIYD